MRKLLLLIACILLIRFSPRAQVTTYRPGEKVDYIIHYGLLTGGVASLELKRDTLSGRELWHSVMIARTTGIVDAIFKVKDIYESYMDSVTELPVKSIRNISEGRYRKYNEVFFDHTSRQDSTVIDSDLTGMHIAPPNLHDILSCFYWFRNHVLPDIENYKKGDVITIMTWFTDELYPISMKYVTQEEIRTRAGKVRCYKFNPVTEKGRLFKTEEDVSFWFSADKNFLPVKIRFDIFVGGFMVDMVSYDGLQYPLDIKIK